jgi:hypothetical protein
VESQRLSEQIVFLATCFASLDTLSAEALAAVTFFKTEPGYKPAAVQGAAAVIVERLSSAAELIIVLVPTGLGNTSMAPSSGGGQVAPIFFGLLVTLASGFMYVLAPAGLGITSVTVAELAAGLICVPAASVLSDGVALWNSAPSTGGGPASDPICVLASADLGNTYMTVTELAADLICVPAASVVRNIVAALAAGIFLHVFSPDAVTKSTAASSISGSAAPSMLAGIVTEFTSHAVLFFPPPCDWLFLLLVLLSRREIGGRDAAVLEVLAEAYSDRRMATLCLSGLGAFRFG